MSPKQPARIWTEPGSVNVERFYQATPERLFQAWTDPTLTSRWLAPGPMSCKLPLYEARKGGRFRIEMSGPGPDGRPMTFVYEGTFEEVTPNRRIVMRWQVVGQPEPPSTVTVVLTPVAGGTKLLLTQDQIPDKDYAESAGQGWASAFEKMDTLLTAAR